jgi:hypothetical protein
MVHQPADMVLALLAARADDATVCPSEVARRLTADLAQDTPGAWRDAMPLIHAAVDRLLAEDQVQLSWKGAPLAPRTMLANA